MSKATEPTKRYSWNSYS